MPGSGKKTTGLRRRRTPFAESIEMSVHWLEVEELMKAKGTRQPEHVEHVKLFVVVHPDLKRRLESAARQDGMTRHAWVVRAIEDRLVSRAAKVAAPDQPESSEYLQEQKLDDIRALRETW